MADITTLRPQIDGKIYLSSDREYSKSIKNAWNGGLREKKPIAFVQVQSSKDVAKTVKFCVENKLDFCVSCGCTSDFPVCDDAVVIDLCKLNEVHIDSECKTAIIGGGTILKKVDNETCKHGFVIPLGSYPLLGVAGMTLIGGIGYLTPSYGCTSDNVIEFELVTINGDIIKASNEEREELFWGMKGHGSNFGIVTSMKFNLHDMPRWIVGGSIKYSLSEAKEKLIAVRDFYIKNADNRLCLYMMLHLTATGWDMEVRLLFNGPAKEGVKYGGELVQDLEYSTHPRSNSCAPVHHHEFQRDNERLFSAGKYSYATAGHFLTELSDDVIFNLVDAMDNVPIGPYKEFADTTIYMNTIGGRLNEIDEETSSFPFRTARFWIGMAGACASKNRYDDMKKWVNDVQEMNEAFGEPPFGGKAEPFDRLAALKLEYDPNNVFHHNINIKPKELKED